MRLTVMRACGPTPTRPFDEDVAGPSEAGQAAVDPGNAVAPELQDAMELDNDSDSEVSLYEGEGASVRSASVISGDGADWGTAVVPPAPLALEAEHASDTEQADPLTATPAPSSAPAAMPRPRSPRKGSGAWLHAKRLEPVKEGHDMSVLQAAYSIAEIKSGGAPNAVCDKVCQFSSRMLLKETPKILPHGEGRAGCRGRCRL